MERVLWIASAVIAAVQLYDRAHVDPLGLTEHAGVPATPTASMFDQDSVSKATERTVQHDPFRLERRPASVAFSTTPAGVPAAPVTAAPLPRIGLNGTIGGPSWQAILSGIPGHDGTVVMRAGDTLGGVLVRRVTRDSAVVRVKDSTWAVVMARGSL